MKFRLLCLSIALSFSTAQPFFWGEPTPEFAKPVDKKAIADVHLSDIIGIDDIITEVRELIGYIKNPEVYKRLGAKPLKGILLEGPSGVGKTLLAKAIANETGAPFFNVSAAELESKWVGGSAENVRTLFKQARKHAQKTGVSIIFLDEFDAIGRERSKVGKHTIPLINQLLTELDGFGARAEKDPYDYWDDDKPDDEEIAERPEVTVIVIAATNYAQAIDKALKRPGRFDRVISIKLPDLKARTQILEFYISQLPVLEKDINIAELSATLAAQTRGFSGAELANLVIQAPTLTIRRGGTSVSKLDFETALLIKKKEFAARRRSEKAFAQPVPDEEIASVKLEDIAGLGKITSQIRRIISDFKDPSRILKLGGKVPGGILLEGPPGVGKTMIAKAIANQADATFFNIAAPELQSKWVGEGAGNIKELFEKARQFAPSIIFIDEIDAIGKKREGMRSEANTQLVNQLLAEMDGFGPDNQILVIAATNFAKSLDTALIRPGRFDKVVTIKLPTRTARAQILELYISKLPTIKDIKIKKLAKKLAKKTEGFSGAELKNIVDGAVDQAAKLNRTYVTESDFMYSLQEQIKEYALRSGGMTPKTQFRKVIGKAAEYGAMFVGAAFAIHQAINVARTYGFDINVRKLLGKGLSFAKVKGAALKRQYVDKEDAPIVSERKLPRLSELVGMNEAVQGMKNTVVEYFTNRRRFEELGSVVRLIHLSGTDTKLLAQAAAQEAGVPFVSPRRVTSETLETVLRGDQPQIVFLDIQGTGELDAPPTYEESIAPHILNLISTLHQEGNIRNVVIVVSTPVDTLTPEQRMQFSIAQSLNIDPPDEQGRAQIIKRELKKLPFVAPADLNEKVNGIAQQTEDWNRTQLITMINYTRDIAAQQGASKVTWDHVGAALEAFSDADANDDDDSSYDDSGEDESDEDESDEENSG